MADPSNILAPHWGTTSFAEKNAVLQALKNRVVGHTQKKEQWVCQGVLEPIVQVLDPRGSSAKMNGKETHNQYPAPPSRPLSEEEQARLQALELLGAFAFGGPSFLDPLAAAGALPVILAHICPGDNHPKLVLAALRALVSLSRSAQLASSPRPLDTASLAQMIFSRQHLESLYTILSQTAPSQLVSQARITTAATLIGILCREEDHQIALANAGILDALATRLTSFAVARGQVVPNAEALAQNDGIAEAIPAAALPSANLGAILEAIAAITGESRLRACMLLYSHSILAVFPHVSCDGTALDIGASWTPARAGGLARPRDQRTNVVDHLLPVIPTPQSRALTAHFSPFPPLGGSLSQTNLSSLRSRASSRLSAGLAGWDSIQFESSYLPDEEFDDSSREDPESPFIPWLISLVRSTEGNERLMAASLLTSLYKAGFAGRSRESDMGALVAPLLLQLLSDMQNDMSDLNWIDPETHERWTAMERTLTILARLVSDSEPLQKCAYDCNAVKIISGLLKTSYEPLPAEVHRKPWNPTANIKKEGSPELDRGTQLCTLGPPGQSVIHTHRAQLRESALKAIAAIIASKEEYRKGYVEQDLVTYVVESLSQTPSKPTNTKDRASATRAAGDAAANESAYGTNSSGVLIAACHCLRMLSRSPSILRTTLQDAGIAMPVFHLLRHSELEVQIVATGVICNLVTDVSPMREEYMNAGVMKILCEHAHSLSAPLRLNALWALKHLVLGAPIDRKRACLEELSPGWLVQLICDDTEDDALYERTRTESERQAAADRMDDDDAMDEDVDMTHPSETRSGWAPTNSWANHNLPEPETSHLRSRVGRLRRGESRIAALRDAEINPVRKARNDDLAIQEQGLLFIRNFIVPQSGSDGKETPEMVDYLFDQLDQDRLFEILASKLKVKILHPFSRRGQSGSGSSGGAQRSSATVLYPQPRIIEAVVFLLVHISASIPRHRQLVISQTELLKALAAHFTSRDKEVRVSLCHLLSNLSWREDANDGSAALQRTLELKRLGLLTKLEQLEQDDQELDVRERAKTAIHQMSNPLSR